MSLLRKTRLAHKLVIWEVRKDRARPPETSRRSNFGRSPEEEPPGPKSFNVLDQRSNHEEAWMADMATDSMFSASAEEKERPSFFRDSTEHPSVS